MKKISISALIVSLFLSTSAFADGHGEVNIFNARHYKADAELYDKFTAKTGIKVNLINGKSGALEKRMTKRVQILKLTFTSLQMQVDVERLMQKVCFKVD
tara:strand:+ start:784 stop:1083 length:300 start_codon:yes stop_codon:yes gene_type:complete